MAKANQNSGSRNLAFAPFNMSAVPLVDVVELVDDPLKTWVLDKVINIAIGNTDCDAGKAFCPPPLLSSLPSLALLTQCSGEVERGRKREREWTPLTSPIFSFFSPL